MGIKRQPCDFWMEYSSWSAEDLLCNDDDTVQKITPWFFKGHLHVWLIEDVGEFVLALNDKEVFQHSGMQN